MLGARCKVRGGSERELTMLTILTMLVQGCARCEVAMRGCAMLGARWV